MGLQMDTWHGLATWSVGYGGPATFRLPSPGHDKHDTRVVCECEALPWVPADITPRYLRGAAASRHLAKQGTE